MPPRRPTSVTPQPDPDALLDDSRWLLARRLAASACLSRASQLRDILLYIVRESVLTADAPIREAEIAHRVLGRRSDFNPLDDNIVRVQMAHLRKKLEAYFSSEGSDEPLILSIAHGSYKPIFTLRTVPQDPAPAHAPRSAATEVPVAPENEPSHPAADADLSVLHFGAAQRVSLATTLMALAAVLILAAVVVLLAVDLHQRRQMGELRNQLAPWRSKPAVAALWANFFDSANGTDLVLGDDSLLLIEQLTQQAPSFNGYINRTYMTPPADAASRTAVHLVASKGLGSTSEFKLAQEILTEDPGNQRIRIYGARQYVPTLLKQNNVVLIGGRISNPWEELFDEKLNFHEAMAFIDVGVSHVTNNRPQGNEPKEWVANDAIGYCVIAYLPNQSTGRSVLLLEGTNSEATEAAGDFLFSEDQLSSFQRRLGRSTFPPFEVLLKIVQVKGTPLTASIEAYRAY